MKFYIKWWLKSKEFVNLVLPKKKNFLKSSFFVFTKVKENSNRSTCHLTQLTVRKLEAQARRRFCDRSYTMSLLWLKKREEENAEKNSVRGPLTKAVKKRRKETGFCYKSVAWSFLPVPPNGNIIVRRRLDNALCCRDLGIQFLKEGKVRSPISFPLFEISLPIKRAKTRYKTCITFCHAVCW